MSLHVHGDVAEMDASGGSGEPTSPAFALRERHPAGERPVFRDERPSERPAVAPAPAAPEPKAAQPRKRGLIARHPFAAIISLVVLLALVAGGYLYLDHAGHFETTDDAFIASRQFSVAPKAAGYITAVPVTDNQHVKAGDVIARIDDRDYRTALTQAEGQVAAAQSGIKNIDAQINVQQAQIAASQARLNQAQAGLTFAQQQADRYQQLAQRGAGTLQNQQQYEAQLRQAQAAVQSAEATIKVAQRQVEALQAQRANAAANLTQAQAQRDQAQLNLSYTVIRAAQPGRVVNLTAAVGQYAQPGTTLAMFVPDEVWVAANFKETQLDHMRAGQPAVVTIDAYPDHKLRGHVASIQPGSGTAFSLLPSENATGNFVKVVQRVPVKIVLDNPPRDLPLGPGMSVEPTVRINPAPSLYERLKAWL